MYIYIKNMVCPRCITAVKNVLQQVELSFTYVELGEVELSSEPTPEQLVRLNHELQALGFELLDDIKKKNIEKIKTYLIEIIQKGNIDEHFSLSEHISNLLPKEYSSISKLFSQVEGITIEQFFILQKIEKVKEWMIYNEYSLSEIAFKLDYSSVAYLSNQFKKITGLTPTAFKEQHRGLRKSLDDVNS
jgi:AraC family transcriptional regulator